MSKITGTRLLRKQIPGIAVDYDDAPPYIGFTGPSSSAGWEIYGNDLNTGFAIWRGYFDIQGWSKEQLSAFIGGAGWQESDGWNLHDPQLAHSFAPEINTWDIISKAPIPNSALDAVHFVDGIGYFGWNGPGMSRSNYDLEEIFAARHRQFVVNTILNNVLMQNDQNIWGAGDATAGDKIYITRIISTGVSIKDGSLLIVPPQGIILPATVVDEKDLVYMERLRRSYVLGESRNP